MAEERRKRGPVFLLLSGIGGVVVAALLAALFTFLIMLVADYILFSRPPFVTGGMWRAKFFERINWTFVTIFWGVTFFAVLITFFGDRLRRWGRKKLGGEW